MKRTQKWSLGVAILAVLAIAAPAARAGGIPDQDAILKGLASDNFSVREQAQQALEKLPLTQLQELRQLAAQTKDLEVQGRLTARVEEMEADLAINVPGISLNIKDATIAQAVAAVNAAIGRQNLVVAAEWRGNGQDPLHDQRFTLKADNAPFWEVMQKLADQGPAGLSGDTLGTYIGAGISRRNPATAAGIFLTRIDLHSWAQMKGPGIEKGSERWVFTANTLVDPRVRVLKLGVTFTALIDDAGNDLLANRLAAEENENAGGAGAGWTSEVRIPQPAIPPKAIAKMSCVIHATVAVKDETRIIEAAPENQSTSLELAQGTLTLERTNNQDVRIHLKPSAASGPLPVEIRLIDQDQTPLAHLCVEDGSQVGLGVKSGAWRVEVVSPVRLKQIEQKIELHDLPFPPR